MTHPVEHCGADGFNNEVVVQTQFFQALVEVIWIHSQRRDKQIHNSILKYSDNNSYITGQQKGLNLKQALSLACDLIIHMSFSIRFFTVCSNKTGLCI